MTTAPALRRLVLPLALLGALAACTAEQAPAPAAADAPAAAAIPDADAIVGTREPFAAHATYFVLTDRFANGDPSNDHRDQGGDFPTFDRPTPGAPEGMSDNVGYLGGDFRGLLDNAGYIREMGFSAVWITPIVDNPDEHFTGSDPVRWGGMWTDGGKTGYHGYWGVDFYRLDEHLPSADLDFRGLTAGLREAGLKTVLDIVANHGAPAFSAPTDRPAFGRLYRDGVLVANHQNLHPTALDPANNPLHAWFLPTPDVAQLSNLDDTNPEVLDYFVGAYSQWIEQGADAFRIDTIRHVGHPFWKAFTDRIRAEHPGFYMFGEHFDYDADAIATHTWPENGGISVLDFPMQEAMLAVFGEGFDRGPDAREPGGQGFERLAPTLHLVDGPYADPYALTIFYDNHDMPRMQASDEGFIDAHHWLFTARGIPVVYYGSEVGFMRGTAEHAGNRNFWGQEAIDAARAHPIRAALARIARVREASPALQRGLMRVLRLEGEQAAFLRVLEDGDTRETVLVLLNKADGEALVALPDFPLPGAWTPLLDGEAREVAAGGAFSAVVEPHGVQVYRWQGEALPEAFRASLREQMARQAGPRTSGG